MSKSIKLLYYFADASEDPTDLAIPLEYDWESVSAYWGLRPVAVARRAMTVMLAAAGFGLGAPLAIFLSALCTGTVINCNEGTYGLLH